MSYTHEQRETIGALAADALFASNGQTNTHADYGNESEALGAAVGAYLAAHDSRPERLADVITALLAPFGEGVTVETLLLLARQHGGGDGYDFACRLALGAYLAGLDSRPERLADVIMALLAPFGQSVAIETLLLLARQHDDDGGGDGYDFACRLAGQAIANGGPRDMAECVRHYMPAHVAAHVAAELARQGKPADAMRALAAELEAK